MNGNTILPFFPVLIQAACNGIIQILAIFLKETAIIMTDCETGIVKWFDPDKGYGYIKRDQGGEVYVHYSAIRCKESECILEEGNKVKFVVVQGPKGPQAQDVIVMN